MLSLNNSFAPVESLMESDLSEPETQEDEEIRVLLVEDVTSDALLTRIVLESADIPFSLSRMKNGSDVLSHLRMGRLAFPSELPDLIILDLGLPDMDGFEIMAEMVHMPASIRAIPIVIVTAQKDFEYICQSYPLYFMSYINKPCGTEEIKRILTMVRDWKKKNSRNEQTG